MGHFALLPLWSQAIHNEKDVQEARDEHASEMSVEMNFSSTLECSVVQLPIISKVNFWGIAPSYVGVSSL